MGKAVVVKECASDLVGRGRTTNPSRSHRGHGDGLLTEEINATREAPAVTARVHNNHSPETNCSPTPCGSVDSRMRSNPPGHKGLGDSDSELLLCTLTARGRQRDSRERQARPRGVAERLVVVMKPGQNLSHIKTVIS